MSDMEGSRSSARSFDLERIMAAKTELSYKVDEGYSEETRSQEGIDSPMRMDAGDDSAIVAQLPLGASLQDAVLALGENERRGEYLRLESEA